MWDLWQLCFIQLTLEYHDTSSLARRYFAPATISNTTVVRIYPTEWFGAAEPCLILDLIGCNFSGGLQTSDLFHWQFSVGANFCLKAVLLNFESGMYYEKRCCVEQVGSNYTCRESNPFHFFRYSLKKMECIFTLFVTEVTPWGVTSVITSFGVNIEWTGRESTRLVNFHST